MHSMTLRELSYLVALADLGHFGRAARACHVSQPTLSTQLKKLEESLGVALFERTNKTLHITPIGEQIVAKARWVLEEAESIVSLARRRSGPLTGPMDLGVIPTLGPYLLPWLLPPLESAFPEMRLVVHEDLTDRLLDQLRTHQIDAALLALPIDDRDLNVLPIFDEPFRLVLPPGHRLIGTSSVPQSELHEEHLLLLSEGHCFREQALAVCGPETSRVENQGTDIRAASLETVCRMVAAGMGCTLLPAMALTGAGRYDFEVCPLDAEASRRIGMVWRQTYPRTMDLEYLAAIIRENLPTSVRAV